MTPTILTVNLNIMLIYFPFNEIGKTTSAKKTNMISGLQAKLDLRASDTYLFHILAPWFTDG